MPPPKVTHKAPKKHRYPYELRPVEIPDDSALKVLDKADLLEFIRVEALLRAPEVHELFEKFYEKEYEEWKKKLKSKDKWYLHDSLFVTYAVAGGWLVIGGSHHALLSPKTRANEKDHEFQGIVDLSSLLNSPPPHVKAVVKNLEAWLLNRIKSQDERWLWLRIDTSYPPHAILNSLLKELTRRHKQIGRKPQDRTVIIESGGVYSIVKPTYENPFRDFKAWINYFKCYDLRYCEGLSYGQIALKVFGKSGAKSYDLAKKACKRVQQVIAAAEENDWPPSSIR